MLKIKKLFLVLSVFIVPAVFTASCYEQKIEEPVENKPTSPIFKELNGKIEEQYFPFQFNAFFKKYALIKSVSDMEIFKKNLNIKAPIVKKEFPESVNEFEEFEKTKNDFLTYLDNRFNEEFFEKNDFVFFQTSYAEKYNSGLFLDSISHNDNNELYLNFIFKT